MSEPPVAVLADGLTKRFEGGHLNALTDVDLRIESGEYVAIVGPSGCGKSTLLHLIAALDRPTSGALNVNGHDLTRERALHHFRAREVGIVFQLDNLLPSLSASENVEAPMFEVERNRARRRARAEDLLASVGLRGKEDARPTALSGGERQRVAIARALANHPAILLADEPTGRLDSASGKRVLDLLDELRTQRQITIILVTHDPNVAARAARTIRMLDGGIVPASADATSPGART
ncbi:MAG TPA: ABC transporter ATP-binding protein [Tepidiformaceae bacterium]|nr:ABC transporter ATP-binding protein [Tepidiformaceae bacterium]